MALRFRLADEVDKALPKTEEPKRRGHDVAAADGYVVVRLDERKIGSFKSLYSKQALSEDDIMLRYRERNGAVKFATNAYFFQEGHGKYYQAARYGQFRVDGRGEVLLVAMFDKDLMRLEPDGKE